MRRLVLTGSFIFLVAAVLGLWQYRFERATGFPLWQLSDLRSQSVPSPGVEWTGTVDNPGLRLRVGKADPRSVTCFEFPAISPIDFIHLRYRLAATHLLPGTEAWEDGRAIIEWRFQDRADIEHDPFASVRFSQSSGVTEAVLRPERPPAIPSLRLEHLGVAGEMDLEMCEVTVLRERPAWKIGRWIVSAAWIVWLMLWIGPTGAKSRYLRPLLAASICLGLGLYFVVPGPWKIIKPLLWPFQFGQEITQLAPATTPPPAPPVEVDSPPAPPLASVGEIAPKGDLSLRIKLYAAKARPLLHALLLFAPTLVISCLVGRRRAVLLMILFALAIESAQVAFGYGFDRVDMFDLAWKATGIALGVLAYHRLLRFAPPAITRYFV
ncbi:MAG: hypothetical protein WED15_08030 [Akkermansiaceae bacterium]